MESENSFIIVGIGASAGGLEALEIFLTHLPADTGMAYVLVQHLDPGHPSLMTELLARKTSMPVRAIENDLRAQPNCFYVMPPNVSLTIQGGLFKTETPVEPTTIRTHIDAFLRSLAEDQTVNAVGVVLSGAGSDGTVGLKAIKEQGGVTMVQSPDSAKFNSMPLSAISTGLVDYTLPVEEIPAKLVEHAKYLAELKRKRPVKSLQEEAREYLPRICEILHHITGNDFSGYKPSTMARRVERRLQVHHLDAVVPYIATLEADPAEAHELLKDFLISVTEFFRDPVAFEALDRLVIPPLLENKGTNARVRVWVPGCASGEEAYSIAILLSLQMARLNVAPTVHIFATDIDPDAINVARFGKYPAALLDRISPEIRERFFSREGDVYQISKQIREMCVFSLHNVVRDPPFSALDLISCRNLLIYMDGGLQKKLIPLFHYALAARGYLFLGSSEGLADYSGLFREVDKKQRIFQRVDVAARPPIAFPTAERILSSGRQGEPATMRQALKARDVGNIVGRMSLEYAPPCVVINAQGGIVYSSGETSLYLQQPTGAATMDIVEHARIGLRISLRKAIRETVNSRTPVIARNVRVNTPNGMLLINLIVRPLPELTDDSGLFAVIFQPLLENPPPEEGAAPHSADLAVQQLETELKGARGDLQTTVEDLESANQELKSSNEELLSMNEEMQSANEELQTSKEEMQSVNEELATVNAELNRKVEQLNTANADLQNLFRSTEIATLFLDRDLRIRRFTPAATAIFHLIDGDAGRSISDFSSRLADGQLTDEIREVLQSLTPKERLAYLPETQTWFMVRMLSSRGPENEVDGVVVTFADVTELKRSEQNNARLAAIVESSDDAILSTNLEGSILTWNSGAERLLGFRADEIVGQPILRIVPEDRAHEEKEILSKVRQEPYVHHLETVRLAKDRQPREVAITVSALKDPAGKVNGVSKILHDIAQIKRAERDLAAAKSAAEAANKAKDQFLAVLSHELRTPLAPVLLTTESLELDRSLSEEHRDMVQMIRRNVELEVRLIDDLLDVTRITRNKLVLHKTRLDAHKSIQHVMDMCNAGAKAKKINVQTRLTAKEHFVSADSARLQQILWNVLKNAIKFTPISGRITITTANPAAGRLNIEISDTGVGIEKNVLPTIFAAFEQGGREITQKFGGLGLGLAISKALVELHGGHIHAASNGREQGATFTIELPTETNA